jgi:hypothetical protein
LIVAVPVFVTFSVACNPPGHEFSTVHDTAPFDGTDDDPSHHRAHGGPGR